VHDFGPSPQGPGTAIAVDAPQWLQDNRIRYRLLYADPTEVRYYTLDRWIAPPSLLLARRLESIAAHGLQPRVQLLEFEQVFEAPGRAYVLVGLRVTAQLPGKPEPVAEQFLFKRPTATPDAAGAIAAFAELADELVRRIGGLLSGWAR
jgi:cholesterol transport system auxiliary component